jgi:DNA-binding transcriptional regulator GbsR (MarR family)
MNNIHKNIILVHARNYRKIQETQVDPIINYISKELIMMFPGLGEQEYVDWAYDIINCSSNQEVVKILERLATIQSERNFKCGICGENTYDVDIDYLIGTDHISCRLEKESKQKTPDSTSSLWDQVRADAIAWEESKQKTQDSTSTIEERLSVIEQQLKRLGSYEDLAYRIQMLENWKEK